MTPTWPSFTPLGWASWGEQRQTVELLGRHSRDVWSLTYAGRVERLREVLRDDPERARVTSPVGDTPLMWLPDDPAAALAVAALLLPGGILASFAPLRERRSSLLRSEVITVRTAVAAVGTILLVWDANPARASMRTMTTTASRSVGR